MNRILLLAALAAPAFSAQTKSMSQGPHKMEMTLERKVGNAWRVVDPGTIFSNGDLVRFRFKANFAGNLYVMNQGTGGTYSQLFPREDTGLANRVQSGKEYVIPSTDGSFRIEGPAGHDIIYWVIHPGAASETRYTPLPSAPAPGSTAASTLTPRCDDAVFRARGACVDSNAGPQAVPDKAQLPDNIRNSAPAKDPELVFQKKDSRSLISSPVPLSGPVVYEFRLAHK
ncbi:MAG: DUF4384 domain-containing protein [Candidatus Solibacter usitatus]|nr:DUF4384 domain-containing protein [Candidatus Solibacter usitatus]